MNTNDNQVWPGEVYKSFLDIGITQAAYVPDGGLFGLINLCEQSDTIKTVPLTSEQEGVAMLCGTYLGGARGVLLMQSSGVGNCINMLSMAQECRVPLLILVTMRGQWAEFNPWQVPMGQGAEAAFNHAGVIVNTVDQETEIGATVLAAGQLAFNTDRAVSVLVGQRAIGTKQFHK